MKIGKQKKGISGGKLSSNNSKRTFIIIGVVALTSALIFWVWGMAKKAEETVQVIMIANNVYKNETITESMLKPYDMIRGEFEKYALVEENGTKSRRLLLWEERDKLINTFAAYPLKKDTPAEYRDFIISRVDNSDSVLYSFPGKEIVPLEVGTGELQAFKTFLKPGDRMNIEALFTEKETVQEVNADGSTTSTQVENFKTETLFKDIMIADLLNGSGSSVLDIYTSYNDKSVWEQAELDSDEEFTKSVEPSSLLVALTPEEKERYYYYLSKGDIKFKASMPQRTE